MTVVVLMKLIVKEVMMNECIRVRVKVCPLLNSTTPIRVGHEV